MLRAFRSLMHNITHRAPTAPPVRTPSQPPSQPPGFHPALRRGSIRLERVNDIFLGNAFVTRAPIQETGINLSYLNFLLDALTVPDMKESCPICLEPEACPVVQICEGHYFCRPCIGAWLTRNNTCPICRKEIEETSTQI